MAIPDGGRTASYGVDEEGWQLAARSFLRYLDLWWRQRQTTSTKRATRKAQRPASQSTTTLSLDWNMFNSKLSIVLHVDCWDFEKMFWPENRWLKLAWRTFVGLPLCAERWTRGKSGPTHQSWSRWFSIPHSLQGPCCPWNHKYQKYGHSPTSSVCSTLSLARERKCSSEQTDNC